VVRALNGCSSVTALLETQKMIRKPTLPLWLRVSDLGLHLINRTLPGSHWVRFPLDSLWLGRSFVTFRYFIYRRLPSAKKGSERVFRVSTAERITNLTTQLCSVAPLLIFLGSGFPAVCPHDWRPRDLAVMDCGDHGITVFFWRAMILVVVVGDHVSFNKLLAGKKYPKAGMKEKYMVMNLWVLGRQYEIYPLFSGTMVLFARGELRRSTGFEP